VYHEPIRVIDYSGGAHDSHRISGVSALVSTNLFARNAQLSFPNQRSSSLISRKRVCYALAGLAIAAGLAPSQNLPSTHRGTAGTDQKALPRPQLPLSFELNEGQAQPEIKALSRGKGYGLLLTSNESVVILQPGEKKKDAVLRLRTLGSNPSPRVTGLDPLPGTVSYLTGNDPEKWRTGIRTYARVRYESVYSGIDLIYYGNQGGQLEYDFVVAPGADPNAIRLGVAGANKLRIDKEGNLVMATGSGSVVHHKPVIYQDIEGKRQLVAGSFLLRGSNEVAFSVSDYDRRHSLVIDPSLGFFTYFGGTGTDQPKAIAVSSPTGITFVGGLTTSTSLPGVAGAPYGGGAADGFITAYGPNAGSVSMTVFLGGSGTDVVNGLAIDPAAVPTYLVATGITNSPDFPRVNAAQNTFGGVFDGFVTKFNIALSGFPPVPQVSVAFSTYLGGSSVDMGNGVAVASSAAGSSIFVTGATLSPNFPTLNAQQAGRGGAYDAFLTKYNSNGTVAYSTLFGGAASEMGNGVAVLSRTSPTPAALPFVTGTTQYPGGQRALVLSYNETGSALTYVKTLGGAAATTLGQGIAVDAAGNAYVTGITNDAAFPVVAAVQATYGGNNDAYVAKLDPAGTTVFATYLGGVGYDNAYAIAVDTFNAGNNIFIAGLTTGFFPVTAVQTTYGGGSADAFVVGLKGGGGNVYTAGYATYLGGSGTDAAYAISVGSAGHARVAGLTNSPGLATAGVAQSTIAGGYDTFVARIQTTPW
jgi:hypothetical protein